MRKVAVSSLVAAALLLVACGGQKPQASSNTQQGGQGGASVRIEATEFAFNPKNLSATAGSKSLTLENKGTIEHDLKIDALNAETGLVSPNSSKSVTVDLKPGSYEFYCTVPGHKEAGMVGTLTVS